MFGKVECVTDNDSVIINLGEYPVFHSFYEIWIEKEIDIVDAFEICVKQIIFNKCYVFVAIQSVHPSPKTN